MSRVWLWAGKRRGGLGYDKRLINGRSARMAEGAARAGSRLEMEAEAAEVATAEMREKAAEAAEAAKVEEEEVEA